MLNETLLPVGTIIASMQPADSLPSGWLPCDGSKIHDNYQNLITLLGTDTTPNLIGRTLIGAGPASSASTNQSDHRDPDFSALGDLALQDTGGECMHTLTEEELPTHSHQINDGDFGIHHRSFDGTDGNDCPFETNADGTKLGGTDTAGRGGAHYNVQPYFAVTYLIYAGLD